MLEEDIFPAEVLEEDPPDPMDEGEVYFAREAPFSDAFAAEIEKRIHRFYDHVRQTGRLSRWRRGLRMLNGLDPRGGAATSAETRLGGEQGELVTLRINMFRSFLRSMHTYVTGSRPAMQPRAIAVDAQTTNRTSLAFSLMDYYLGKGNVEKLASEAAFYAMPYGDTWLDVRWDNRPSLPYMMEAEVDTPVNGDVRVYMRTADNVIRDVDAPDIESLQWLILRSKVPRWDLIQQYPDRKDLILNAKQNANWRTLDATTVSNRDRLDDEDRDFVTIFEFFHVPCPALPQGRMATWISGEILDDRENIYGELPAIPMAPSSETGTPFGYGESWDMMALQEAYDSVATQLVTTQENFGLRNIFVQINSGLQVSMIGSGLRMLQGTTPPSAIDLEGGAVESAIQTLGWVKGELQGLTGLNDVALGDASKSQSGAALAMLHSLTVQFHSGMQREYSALLERSMYAVLKRLRKFATEKRLVLIVGKNKAPSSRDFVGKDLTGIVGIDVEIANPVMRTTAGRVQVMKDLLDAQMITKEQYLEGISTGRLEPIQQFALSQRMLLEMENERLLNGEYPPVLLTDDHALHIQEHSVLLNDPLTRQDQQLSDRTLAHIQSHLNLWKGIDPVLLAALGLAPAPIPPPPPGMELEPHPQNAQPAPGMLPPPAPMGPPGGAPSPGGGVNPGGAPAQSLPGMPSAPQAPLPAA